MRLRLDALVALLILGEMATALYIGGIAQVAVLSGVAFVLFPELAALAYDVFRRPRGVWANAPLMLVATPVLTSIAGVAIEHGMPYGFPSVLLSVAIALLIIKALDSPVAPAISAGLLPVVLGEGSWWYPLSILFGTSLLAVSLLVYRKSLAGTIESIPEWLTSVEDDLVEQAPSQYAWLPFFVLFLVLGLMLVELTDWRFILFPPLVVIGFEMFAHPEVCPWADRPIVLSMVCSLTAFAGLVMHLSLGGGPEAAILAVAIAMGICRVFRIYIPPAIAVSLLPFVIASPDFRFPLAVAGGTLLLAGTFLSYRYFSRNRIPARQL